MSSQVKKKTNWKENSGTITFSTPVFDLFEITAPRLAGNTACQEKQIGSEENFDETRIACNKVITKVNDPEWQK